MMETNKGISDLEVDFVQNCVIQERKDRLLYELAKSEKREVAISRFAHQTDSLIQAKRICSITDSEHVPSRYFDGNLRAMYLTDDGGKDVSREDARNLVSVSYGPLIIVSSLKLAIIKTEDNQVYLLDFAPAVGARQN